MKSERISPFWVGGYPPFSAGGPDRRFKNNREIPVCSYGKLKIEIGDKLLLYIMTSLEDAPREFKEAMDSIQKEVFDKD